MNQFTTEIDTLKKWFPYLKGIESAEWEKGALGSDKTDIPGPGAFRACGYIVLDPDVAKEYEESYSWEDITPDVSMELVDPTQYNDRAWKYSEEWEEEVKPGYYIGHFYYSDGVVLFDVVR